MPDPVIAGPSTSNRQPSQFSSDGSSEVDDCMNESPTHESFGEASSSQRSSMSASVSPPIANLPGAPSHQAPGLLARLAPKFERSQHEQQLSQGQTKRERRFACDFCDASYPHRKNLREHKQTKHLRLRYTCDVAGCGASMAQKKNLARHKAMKHTNGNRHLSQTDNLDLNMNR
jgi:ribosomal protein L44E